jgi:hypothetical protein
MTPPSPHICRWCAEPVDDGPDLTSAPFAESARRNGMHPECMFRACAGSVAHIEQRCSCFVPGSTAGDDPRLTERQQAEASVACWRKVKLERALAIARGRNDAEG